MAERIVTTITENGEVITGKVFPLKDPQGNVIYPATHEDAVYFSDGKTLKAHFNQTALDAELTNSIKNEMEESKQNMILKGVYQGGEVIVDTLSVSEIKQDITSLKQTMVYNVKEYGAIGDGITDDTDAIQTAFNDIAIDGGVLYIPTGTYIVSGLTLNNRSKSPTCRIHMYGDGWNSILKLKDNSNKDLIYATWCDRAVFTRFRLDGNKANNTAGSCLVLTDNSAYACVEGMEIHDAAEYGVSVIGGFDPLEPTNYLYTDEVHINQSFIYWNGKSGVRLQGTGGCIITNSELQYNEEHGLCTTFNGVSGTNGHIISGCNILSNKGCGISLYISSRITISNNVFCFNRDHGIYTEGDGWNWIIGNQFEDNCQVSHGAQIKTCYQTDAWILNNVITNVDTVNPGAYQGIASWAGGTLYIMGNSVTNHQYGNLAVYEGTTYMSMFNEGISDSTPNVSAKVNTAIVSSNAISAIINKYEVGKIYYLSLNGEITMAANLSVNGNSKSLLDKTGNPVTSLMNGAVIGIYQSNNDSSYQII